MNEKLIQAEYDRLMHYPQTHDANSDMIEQLREWQSGKWKSYLNYVLNRIPTSLDQKTILDFGCRYGLLFPLLFAAGAMKVIGVEELDLFLQPGQTLFQQSGDRITFVRSHRGYVPLQPESADLAIMNEVISHIHPSYLPVVYSEMARILTPGGILFISDGNNLGNPEYASSHLYPLYEALENGPDGTRVGDVQVQSCFINQRRRIIQVRHPDMSIDEVDYLARNTSGLFGDYLDQVIDCFAIKGDLIRRPYRKGSAPVYPDSGQVEEKGFYPEAVVFDLVRTGFDCEILDRPSSSPSAGNRIVLEASQMRPSAGYGHNAYEITMPKGYPVRVSPLLLENNSPLPIPTDNHAEIGEKGRGRYSMWRANGTIYFSSSDNSDPRRNRRRYELYWMDWSAEQPVYPSANFQIVAVKTN